MGARDRELLVAAVGNKECLAPIYASANRPWQLGPAPPSARKTTLSACAQQAMMVKQTSTPAVVLLSGHKVAAELACIQAASIHLVGLSLCLPFPFCQGLRLRRASERASERACTVSAFMGGPMVGWLLIFAANGF